MFYQAMNISFTSKLTVDKNIKSLKKTDIKELETGLRKFVEAPILTDIFEDDVHLTSLKKARYEGLLVKFGEYDIPFDVKKLTPSMVLSQLFMIICAKNDIPWYMESDKGRIEFIKRLIDKKIREKGDKS